MNHQPLIRVSAVFVCVAAVLFGAVSTSANQAPEQFLKPRVSDVSKRDHDIVAPDDPEATYQGARIVHNVTVNGQKGMRVHATFTVRYGLDLPCMLIAYFFYDDHDNTPLKTDDPKYRTKAGTVYAHANFTPAYDPALYKDLQLFMPYSALNMESGDDYDLKFYLVLYDKEGERSFGKSGWYKFHLTMP